MVIRKQIYKIVRLLTYCLLCQLFAVKLLAQEFIIGVEDVTYYPLYDFKSNRDTFSRELLNTFAATKGYTFTFLHLPIKRFERWLIEEKIDFKYPDNERWYAEPSLRDKFTFSQSTIKLIAGTTVLKSSLNKAPSEFKILGTLLGFYPSNWIDEINSGEVELHEDNSATILIRQLLAQHLDGLNLEPSVINYYLTKLGKPTELVTIDKQYKYDVYDYHFSTIKYPKVIEEFNEFLNNNEALLAKMKKKYHIIDYKPYLK